MKAALAIGALCLRRWKWLPVGALLLGAFGAYSTLDREGPGTLALALTNFGIVGALAFAVPAIIGPTEPGRRPDFLFSNPVPWWSVWCGRAAAYVLVSGLSVAAVALPNYLVNGQAPKWLIQGPPIQVVSMALLVFGGLVTVGIASFRARRQVATVTLGAITLVGVGALYLVARIHAYSGWYLPALSYWFHALGFVLLAAPVLVFSVAYLAFGRGEPVRAAVAGSVAAAIAFLPSLLLSGWVLAFSPRHEAWRSPGSGHQATTSPE